MFYKVKVSAFIAQYPVLKTAQSAILPDRPVQLTCLTRSQSVML